MEEKFTCQTIMTVDPACCAAKDTVREAAELMRQEDVGPIPIVDDLESRKLVGVITDRDVAVKVVAEGLDPKTTAVETVMERRLVTCRLDDEVAVALKAMAEEQVRRVLVVDDCGCLRGIIAQADVATRVGPGATGKVVREISR